jgi:hypothetical protein
VSDHEQSDSDNAGDDASAGSSSSGSSSSGNSSSDSDSGSDDSKDSHASNAPDSAGDSAAAAFAKKSRVAEADQVHNCVVLVLVFSCCFGVAYFVARKQVWLDELQGYDQLLQQQQQRRQQQHSNAHAIAALARGALNPAPALTVPRHSTLVPKQWTTTFTGFAPSRATAPATSVSLFTTTAVPTGAILQAVFVAQAHAALLYSLPAGVGSFLCVLCVKIERSPCSPQRPSSS